MSTHHLLLEASPTIAIIETLALKTLAGKRLMDVGLSYQSNGIGGLRKPDQIWLHFETGQALLGQTVHHTPRRTQKLPTEASCSIHIIRHAMSGNGNHAKQVI